MDTLEWRPPRLRSGKSAWGGKSGRRGDRRSPPPVELLPDRYGRMFTAITRVGSGVARAIAMGARPSGRRWCIRSLVDALNRCPGHRMRRCRRLFRPDERRRGEDLYSRTDAHQQDGSAEAAETRRTVKTMRDGFLAELTSVIKAAECAAEVRQKCAVADRDTRFRRDPCGDVIAQGATSSVTASTSRRVFRKLPN